ncbi:hypothetical protein ACQ4M3_39435 [Leptolyngbya sp. AN03gr2]|uniref:hypothetical protein n=1 Tax=unclassified Leptolyngbya TaxID=2650499 RepID=UPI003D322FB9
MAEAELNPIKQKTLMLSEQTLNALDNKIRRLKQSGKGVNVSVYIENLLITDLKASGDLVQDYPERTEARGGDRLTGGKVAKSRKPKRSFC